MNTKQKDEPVQTSTQKTPVSGGSYDRKQKKRIILMIVTLVSLLVIGILVIYFLFFNKQPYSDVTDPRPNTPVNQLTQEETQQRLKARYHVSVEDVKAGKLNIEAINDFDRLVTLGEILVVNEVNDKALLVYQQAEKIGDEGQKNVSFYDIFSETAFSNKDESELKRTSKRAMELLGKSDTQEAVKEFQLSRMQEKLNLRLSLLDEGVEE